MLFAIPFFKNTVYLRETLQSLKRQGDPDWQAVVLDDSIDPKESKHAEAAVSELRDDRFIYQKNHTNLGIAKNWNQALDYAVSRNADLLVILHADDRLKEDYVFEIKKIAKLFPEACGYFARTEIIGSKGSPVFSFADSYKKLLVVKSDFVELKGIAGVANLIPGNFIFCPSICYRLSKFKTERFDGNRKMVMDFEFLLRLLLRNETWVGFYKKPIFEYRRHENNATVMLTRDLIRFKEEIALYQALSDELLKRGEINLAKQAKKMRVVCLNLLFELIKSLLGLKFTLARNEARLLRSVLWQ